MGVGRLADRIQTSNAEGLGSALKTFNPVFRNDSWISANGSAGKIGFEAVDHALGWNGNTGETPMIL
jgi:hypothetical protein